MPVRFSVAIPVWNDAEWLPGAIESVLSQSYDQWELVIGDNASEVDLSSIVERYDDPRIRYHRWSVHTGPAENHNRTMALCRYEWVQVLSADDRLKPECLERMARRAERSADHTDRLVMLVTACNRVNTAGEPVAIMGTDHVAYRLIRSQHISDGLYDAARWLLANAAPGVPPWMFGSVAIARDTLLEIGGFRPEMGLCHDLELAMRVAAYGSVAFIGEPLLDYTVRGDSITGRLVRQHIQSGTSMVQLGAAWISALRAHEARRSVTRKERVTINAAIARAFIQRALLHRRAADGRGRGGAFVDVVRAACFSPRAVFANWRFAVALAAILAPRSVLNQATLLGHRLGIVIV